MAFLGNDKTNLPNIIEDPLGVAKKGPTTSNRVNVLVQVKFIMYYITYYDGRVNCLLPKLWASRISG